VLRTYPALIQRLPKVLILISKLTDGYLRFLSFVSYDRGINKEVIIMTTMISAISNFLNVCDLFLTKRSMISARTEVAIPTKK
jgi:hypothetical protein